MDRESIYKIVDEKIQNCTSSFRDELVNYVMDNYTSSSTSIAKVVKFIRTNYKFNNEGRYNKAYWISRGHSIDETNFILSNIKKDRPKRHTVYTLEYWISKINPLTNTNYTIEEANYERHSLRPVKKEYWMKKGYSIEKSILLAAEAKHNNNIKGAAAGKITINNNRSINYWTVRGYDDETAKRNISELQKTFSLDICIDKYGVDEGHRIWKERQDKWQKSLIENNNMDDINKKKNCYSNLCSTNDDIIKNLSDRGYKNPVVNVNLNDLYSHISNIITQNPYYLYCNAEYVFKKLKVHNYYFIKLSDNDIIKYINDNFEFKTNTQFKYDNGKLTTYRLYTNEGYYLRSSNEINFYLICKDKNINFLYEQPYENSMLKYDFYLLDYNLYVEIAGLLNDNEYYQNMLYKQSEFNSVIIKPQQINHFIESVINGSFNRSDYRLL